MEAAVESSGLGRAGRGLGGIAPFEGPSPFSTAVEFWVWAWAWAWACVLLLLLLLLLPLPLLGGAGAAPPSGPEGAGAGPAGPAAAAEADGELPGSGGVLDAGAGQGLLAAPLILGAGFGGSCECERARGGPARAASGRTAGEGLLRAWRSWIAGMRRMRMGIGLDWVGLALVRW